MKNITFLLFLFYLISFSLQGQQDHTAPVLNLEITVNGQTYHIRDGDTLNIGNDQISVKTSDLLNFDFGAISFDYPHHYAFEFEEDYAYKNWTLDGNNFVIMYFEIGAEAELDMFIAEIVQQFSKENCQVTNHAITLGDLHLKGKRIDINLAGQRLTYDLYKLNTNDFKSHFIGFQDIKNEDGSASEEGRVTMDIISNTIRMK